MSSLIKFFKVTTPSDTSNLESLFVNMNTHGVTPRFENEDGQVGTIFKRGCFVYNANEEVTYTFHGEFTVCFWAKFAKKLSTDVVYSNFVKVIFNDDKVLSANIPTDINMLNYHWIKIQRNSENRVSIFIDDTEIGYDTIDSLFDLSDESWIFVGNNNKYFTGYDVILDDILFIDKAPSKLDEVPTKYFSKLDFINILYIKISDGSVWGYKYFPANTYDIETDTVLLMPLTEDFSDLVSESTITTSGTSSFDAYLEIGSNDFYISDSITASSDFTLDFWLQVTSVEGYSPVFLKGSESLLYIDSGTTVIFNTGTDKTMSDYDFSESISDGEFHHIAFVRSQSSLMLFIDGTLVGTISDATGSLSITQLMTNANNSNVKYLRFSNEALWSGEFVSPQPEEE